MGTEKHTLWDTGLACWRKLVGALRQEGVQGPFLQRFGNRVCSGWQVILQCCWKPGCLWSRPSSTTCCLPSWPTLACWLARRWASTQRMSPAGSSPSRLACSFMSLWWIWWVGSDVEAACRASRGEEAAATTISTSTHHDFILPSQLPEMLHGDSEDHKRCQLGHFILQNLGMVTGFAIMLLIAIFEDQIVFDFGF